MRTIFTFILVILSFSVFTCSKDQVSYDKNRVSSVNMQINLTDDNSQTISLRKPGTITSVRIVVSGSGMDDVQKNLTVSGNSASGTISVPKGDNRKFEVSGLDGSNRVQFYGETTVNLRNETETVTIPVQWIPPQPVNLAVSNITASSVALSWNASSAQDFSFYRILISTSADLDANNDALTDLNNRNTTSFTITGLSPNTPYYVAVIVVDTENRFDKANTQVKNFTTQSGGGQVAEISYDDGSMEWGLRGPTGSWLTVEFDGAQYPLYVQKFRLYLLNNSVGNEVAVLLHDDDTVKYHVSLPTTSDGWIEITPNWSATSYSGVMANSFDIGVEYLVDQGPSVAADTNSTYQATSWYRYPDGTWSLLDEQGFSWNLMIRAVVVYPSGQSAILEPKKISIKQKAPDVYSRQNKPAPAIHR